MTAGTDTATIITVLTADFRNILSLKDVYKRQEVCVLHLPVKIIHQGLSPIGNAVNGYGVKGTVLLHGDAAMVQKIGVVTFIHASMGIEETHMPVKQPAVLKGRCV